MGRELRFRIQGMIFYVVLLSTLSISCDGIVFWRQLFRIQGGEQNIIVPLLGVGLIIFTSDAVGYFFSSIFILIWNKSWRLGAGHIDVLCGYSRHWSKLNYDIQSIIGQHSSQNRINIPTQFELDILLSYFWFYFVPKEMDEWITRRYTIFFTNWAAIISIILALMLSLLITWQNNLNFNSWYWMLLVIWLGTGVMLYLNSRRTLKEILQMIDFWLGSCYNEDLKELTKGFISHMKKKSEVD